MSASPALDKPPCVEEADKRRLAVDNALGSLRIENMDLAPVERQIFERYAAGEISLDELDRLVEQRCATIR
jgi:hypothetical protein